MAIRSRKLQVIESVSFGRPALTRSVSESVRTTVYTWKPKLVSMSLIWPLRRRTLCGTVAEPRSHGCTMPLRGSEEAAANFELSIFTPPEEYEFGEVIDLSATTGCTLEQARHNGRSRGRFARC